MTDKKTLMEFPCDFPIKIIGTNKENFLAEITTLAHKFFPELQGESIHSRPSGQGNYLAISILLYVKDQVTLDEFYKAVGKHPDIKMVL